MFKLFNKKEILVLEKPNIKNYPKEVLEIHHEFNIASDKLLKSAYKIINSQPIINESKVNRLKNFGFTQAKEVVESVKIFETTALSKDQIELVKYYKQNYPLNKFITEPQVKEICYKYNLICGDVGRFKGFVPDINIKDIERFKLKDKDQTLKGTLWGSSNEVIRLSKINHTIDIIEYNKLLKNNLINGIDNRNLNGDQRWCRGEDVGFPEYAYLDNIELQSNKLQICAPVKDMDISGLELIEGYKLQKKHIPDPVILQSVKGGYLIITAWGDEASDPLVVNENFN